MASGPLEPHYRTPPTNPPRGDDLEPDHAGMLALVDLVENGQLTVAIDSVFPLKDAARAHERGETGRARGKIVLQVV